MRILALILLASCAFADSKAEIELRARLAAAQAQIAEQARDKAALEASLAKLHADASASSAAAAATLRSAAATATQRSAAAAQQRNDASAAADANAASAQSTADVNAASSKAAADAIKEQVIELRKDNDRARLIQLIVACGGFVGICVPVTLGAIKLVGDAGTRRGEQNAANAKLQLVQAEARYAAVVAGATASRMDQVQQAIGLQDLPAPIALDPALLRFTLEVPKEHRQKLAAALSKLDHVTVDPNTLTGAAQNSDGSKLDFAVLNETTIGITVTANPNHWTLDQLRAKVVSRITELLAG